MLRQKSHYFIEAFTFFQLGFLAGTLPVSLLYGEFSLMIILNSKTLRREISCLLAFCVVGSIMADKD